ncbi:MAG: hypothetical protein ABGY24_03345 [bacterium]
MNPLVLACHAPSTSEGALPSVYLVVLVVVVAFIEAVIDAVIGGAPALGADREEELGVDENKSSSIGGVDAFDIDMELDIDGDIGPLLDGDWMPLFG